MKTCVNLWSYLAEFLFKLRMSRVTILQKKIKTYILCSITFLFLLENRVVYEITWINTVEPGRPQMTIDHMRIARWIPKATNSFLEYVIFIVFPLQQWLHESASMLCYTHNAYPLAQECVTEALIFIFLTKINSWSWGQTDQA